MRSKLAAAAALALAASSLAISGLASTAAADPPTSRTVWDVYACTPKCDGPRTAPDAVIAGARSVVTQGDSAVHVRTQTRGLDAGHAYTMWIMLFNHPEYCRYGEKGHPCGTLDLPFLGGDPRAGFNAIFGTGHVVGTSGPQTFEANRSPGDGAEQMIPDAPGLTNPSGADIHVHIRDHGPAVPGWVDYQIHSRTGGCNAGEPNEGYCHDDQTTGL